MGFTMEQKIQQENQTEVLAECDYLTGLANRRGLYDHYRGLDPATVIHAMYLDIDNFKRVNDVYGHSMGDKLLIAVSQLIQAHTQGFTSRIGGDEYVVLLDGALTQPQVEQIAKNLLGTLQDIDFRKDILSLISLSIGIVFEQPVSQALDDVLTKCDAAMYQAKHDGKNQYTVFKSDDRTLEINRSIELEMEDALENGEFVVYLQPKVNMITSELRGAEALSRWVHPIDGIRIPDAYVPLFEKNGFISQLDLYIYEEVCRIKSTWIGEKYEHIPISVNMSRLHLYNKSFPEQLADIAKKYEIPTTELELEISESTFLKDSSELIQMIGRLQEKGFMISIDNFGSCFSSMNLLKDLTVDTIKIDREFLNLSSYNSRGKTVMRNVIAMCRDLKMDVVTEGIENKAQVDFITRSGCQTGQGFYYAEPLPLDEFIAFADEYMRDILENYTFRLNGSLESEDGSKQAFMLGDGPSYTDGIFSDSKAMHFPGGVTMNNVLRLPTDCLLNDSFTISLWIRPHELHQWAAALYVSFETGFCGVIPYAWEGHSDFRVRDFRQANGWHDASGQPLNPHTWWHYVATYNSKTETSTVFIDGIVVSILENVPANRYVKDIVLGGDIFQPSFIGDMCELIIYNEPKDYNFVHDLYHRYIRDERFIGFVVDQEEE